MERDDDDHVDDDDADDEDRVDDGVDADDENMQVMNWSLGSCSSLSEKAPVMR